MRSSATPPTRITCLVRELEIFLETFHHDTPTPSGIEMRPLSICVDGSDFTLPKDFPSEDPGAELPAIVEAYLAASRYLLVVSSRGARASVWVRKEVEWFLAHRLPGQVLLAVSQGDDPAEAPDEVFPEPIVNAGLHRRLWYDLRGYRRQEGQQWRKVRDFDDNRVRLAAGLQGVHVRDVQPSWFRAKQKAKQEERARRRVAASKKLALTAQSLIPRQLDLALLLSVAALDLSDTVEARNALLAGTRAPTMLAGVPARTRGGCRGNGFPARWAASRICRQRPASSLGCGIRQNRGRPHTRRRKRVTAHRRQSRRKTDCSVMCGSLHPLLFGRRGPCRTGLRVERPPRCG